MGEHLDMGSAIGNYWVQDFGTTPHPDPLPFGREEGINQCAVDRRKNSRLSVEIYSAELELGAWDLFGVWNWELGVSTRA
jgi:hypothetical protein